MDEPQINADDAERKEEREKAQNDVPY